MELLRVASPYLGSLSPRELAVLAAYGVELSLPAGRRMLLDGPFAQELVLVATGRGSVRCAGETVGELGPGEIFGTLAPLRATYPAATVTALGELRLVTFSTRDIRHLREAAPDVLRALLDAGARASQDGVGPRALALAPAMAPAPAVGAAAVAAA